MHIPDHMLNGAICPVTAVVSVVGVASATYLAVKSKEKPSSLKFAAIAALIFAAQMMNFPVQNGTSGHFLGTTLAISLLGIPFGILSVVMVVTVQCLVFADGGLSVLGANILNMAIAGAIPGIILNFIFKNKPLLSNLKKSLLIFLGSWLSIVLASSFCSLELGISGTISLLKVFPAMIGIHSIIGIFEGIITVVLFSVLFTQKIQKSEKLSIGIPVIAAGIIGLVLSPFANGFPDGLEWIAEKYAFLHESAPYFVSPFSDYTFPIINNEILTTSFAGLLGVIITFILVLSLGLLLNLKLKKV